MICLIHRRPAARGRRAVSLLEAILALSIMGTALAMLSRVMETGVDAGREAHEMAACRVVAARRMSELLLNVDAGISPTAEVGTPVQDFVEPSSRTLLCNVDVSPGSFQGILMVRVTIESYISGGTRPIATCSLTRWIVDPALDLEGLEAEAQAAAEGESVEGGSRF